MSDPESHDAERIKALRIRAEQAEAKLPTQRERGLLLWFIDHPAQLPRVPMEEIKALRSKLA